MPGPMLQEYFSYIRQNEDKAWIATFADVTKYMRERMNASVDAKMRGDKIVVHVRHSLDTSMYDLPLTAKTVVPSSWKSAVVAQGAKMQTVTVSKAGGESFIVYEVLPNAGEVVIGGK